MLVNPPMSLTDYQYWLEQVFLPSLDTRAAAIREKLMQIEEIDQTSRSGEPGVSARRQNQTHSSGDHSQMALAEKSNAKKSKISSSRTTSLLVSFGFR
jgi:hypothetical protein